jgi:lysine-specific demethylase 8
MTDVGFQSLAATRFTGSQALRRYVAPTLFKGLAAQWPAVQRWDFSELAARVPDLGVKLVAGNRETGNTHFIEASLRSYFESLQYFDDPTRPALYLKEFDLLNAVPALRCDLKHAELFPAGVTRSLQSWIGPAGARTGLHYDYLNNLAVQIVGRKRFYLVRPGTVERLGAVARKYDSWATLSMYGAKELAALAGTPEDFFVVDLEPGDVLHVPAGWWHEVLNLTPGILFGGFYGSRTRVLARWTWVCSRDWMHSLGWIGHGNCTCHANEPKPRKDARPDLYR